MSFRECWGVGQPHSLLNLVVGDYVLNCSRETENSKAREKARGSKLPLQGITQIIAIFNKIVHFSGQIKSTMFIK